MEPIAFNKKSRFFWNLVRQLLKKEIFCFPERDLIKSDLYINNNAPKSPLAHDPP